MEKHVEDYWRRFLAATGRPEGCPCLDIFAFCGGGPAADELLKLVLRGQKTATTSALLAYRAEGTPPPAPGDLSIVLDSAGQPRCVIQTTAARILPFEDVTWEMARREGEDEHMGTWRENHIAFLGREAEAAGQAFSPAMPVIFEDFVMVWPTADA